ncbi:Tfp pilus assembly protein PilV [Paraburkholderia tropica]
MSGRTLHRGPRGSTRGVALLEVVIAMALMTMCGLGLLNAQLGLARHTMASAARTRAAFLADALAEAAQTGAPASELWKSRASTLLPDTRVTVTSAGGAASLATLMWTAQRDEAAPDSQQAAAGCEGSVGVQAPRGCLSLAFAK